MGLRKSKGRVEVAKDRVRPLAESASEKFGPAVGQVRDHLGPAVGTAREKVSPYAEKAVERGAHLAHQAVEKAGPVLDDALAKVGPATEHAAEKARERLNDDLLPKVTAALATLAAAAEPVVEETARRGKATKAALKGELEVPKKSHKLRNVVLFLGLGALAAAAVKKLLTPPEPAWQSTPTSGRDYSSAPAGTTARPADTSASSNGKTESNGKTDGKTDAKPEAAKPEAPKAETKPETKPAAKADEAKDEAKDEMKAASNGAVKKTTTRKATGSSESKPTDS
ncbi:hypothetical protein EV645_2878 [Kribbella rubisoli]|uniref:Uncharacterized protein n=1 Tax=Kribbella rubisoli TaxID=3075929 RepID=A0A4Q7XC11_9ACTN|nr:hypothetical protein [Kribbella rubisoli]RZU20641.1 hypothetical protein EV645_2878 [Kribbella rubisoli]